MKITHLLMILLLATGLGLSGCGKKAAPKPKLTQFVTLDDINGKPSFKESSPAEKVIVTKAKALIKQNRMGEAKKKALSIATTKALDLMVQELLTPALYNEHYEKIEKYLSTNPDKYIIESEVFADRKIFQGRFYGIAAAFRIDRQKVLVALQKDLRIIDNSINTLVTVVTSKKEEDLRRLNISMRDVETAIMNQVQTDLNQRGLRAMDFRNAVTSFNLDKNRKQAYLRLSNQQFMDMVAMGSGGQNLQGQLRETEKFYSTGFVLLKQMAKVVIEVNIINVSKENDEVSLNLGVTAKNIGSPTGGAFANTTIQVSRRGGNSSAMVTRLIKDAYAEMKRDFIPQVIKEMSTIDVGGAKLLPYELVFQGFGPREGRTLRGIVSNTNNPKLVYLDYDNSLAKVQPSINRVFVRYNGKAGQLSDLILGKLDAKGIYSQEPSITPKTTDIVFVKEAKE